MRRCVVWLVSRRAATYCHAARRAQATQSVLSASCTRWGARGAAAPMDMLTMVTLAGHGYFDDAEEDEQPPQQQNAAAEPAKTSPATATNAGAASAQSEPSGAVSAPAAADSTADSKSS